MKQYARRLRDRVVAKRMTQALFDWAAKRGLVPVWARVRVQPLGPHTVTTPSGKTFRYIGDPADVMARSLVWSKRADPDATFAVLVKLIRDAELFVDVGAYSGAMSLTACANSATCRVIGVEPNPVMQRVFAANIAANGWEDRIELVRAAVADQPGRGVLVVPAHDSSLSSLGEGGEGLEVEVSTVDELVNGRRVDIIKIDVEGSELPVLRGAVRTIAAWQPCLIIEILTDIAFDEMLAWLSDAGYSACYHLGPDGPVPVDRYIPVDRRYYNYLFPGPQPRASRSG
jgi:FkbM family methyltransferase